ncbi:MAG: copper amine oxidase [Paenibacillaceae bacterium]|nr:copper amine oxidase [Paenibacillaceae bacterium]
MNKLSKAISFSLLGAMLVGGTSVGAAPFVGHAVISSDNGQVLTSVSTFAGLGDYNETEGAALTASFRKPKSLAVLPDGSVLVADSKNHKIRKIAGGQTSTIAGPAITPPSLIDKTGLPIGGMLDGVSSQSFFNEPEGIAVSAKGDIYIADAGNNTIRKIDTAGNVTTYAGNGVQGLADGKGAEARFNKPRDLAVAADGTIYVADTLNHVIRKIAADGTVTTLNAESGRFVEASKGTATQAGDFKDGALKDALFNEPSGIVIDAKGNLYVSDTGNQRIRYIDLAAGQVTTVAGSGAAAAGNELYVTGDFADGAALEAKFDLPAGIALTDEGALLIADSLNHSVRMLYDGQVSTIAGDANQLHGSTNGIERTAQFNVPTDVALTADGDILVTDQYDNKIRKISLFQLPAALPNDDSYKVTLNSDVVAFDSQPEITNERLMVPVRAVVSPLGYEVTYAEENGKQVIRLAKGDTTIELTVGVKEVRKLVKGSEPVVRAIDTAPYIKEERTLLPLRFFSEEIGLDVQWIGDKQTAVLRSK